MRRSGLGNHEAIDLLFVVTEGLHGDLPSAKILLKKRKFLVEQFAVD
jgi:hypothetical protein